MRIENGNGNKTRKRAQKLLVNRWAKTYRGK